MIFHTPSNWKTSHVFRVINLQKPLLAITFDDGGATDYTLAYPLLISKGILGTSFICQSFGGMTWEQKKEMYAAGWDFQDHTGTHTHLTSITDAEIVAEMLMTNAGFAANDIAIPQHIAYPWGDYDTRVIDVLSSYRVSGRKAGGAPQAYGAYSFWETPGVAGDVTTAEGYAALIAKIDDLVANTKVTSIMLHKVFDGEPGGGGITLAYLTSLIDYALAKGVKITTYSQMYKIVSRYREYN